MKYLIASASTVAQTTARSHYRRCAVPCHLISVVAVDQNVGGVSVANRNAPAVPVLPAERISLQTVTAANDANTFATVKFDQQNVTA
jgi:hypothetical protein